MVEPETNTRKGWHPEQIKAAIRMRGLSCERLSKCLGFSSFAIGQVIRGKVWGEVELAIAGYLDVAPHRLWPDRYHRDGRSRIARRRSRAS